MIWYNIKELENRLIQGEVSDKLIFNYLLTHLIFTTIAGYLNVGDNPNWSVWVHLIINLSGVIWGVRKTFEINKEGDNRDYFKRIISVSFVVGIRLTVLIFIISFFLVLGEKIADLIGLSSGLSSVQEEIIRLSGYLIFIGLYFHQLLSSFKRINSANENLSQGEVA